MTGAPAPPGSTAEVLRRYAAAWRDGDLAAVLDAYHDDLVLHYYGTSPLAGRHAGREAALAALAEATVRSHRELVEVVDVLEGASLGALVVVERLGDGQRSEPRRRVLLFRVADGRLAECWLFDEDQRAVDALWSTPADATPQRP